MINLNSFRCLALLFSLTSSSFAQALNLGDLQGDTRREYRSPQGLSEICVISKKWPGGLYSGSDLEKENELCSYNFYSNVGICPKYNSTNPGVLILFPNSKYSKEAIDASDCNVDIMGVKTEAKFKQSVTCSYTPSILSYYHLSRILGGAGRVPPAAIRTIDMNTHAQLTTKALKKLKSSAEIIALGWRQLAKVHQNPRQYPLLVDSSLSQMFGALSDNVKKEEHYTEVSGRGTYEGRYSRFLKQKSFLKVSSSKSVRQIVGSADFAKVAQDVTQMKDVADMVLLDTLLNQQDRIGNIHYKFYWYSINPSTARIDRNKSDAKWVKNKLMVPPEETKSMAGRKAALVKEMVLKDNDCGVIKDNMMRKISALEKVRHFSYQTYRLFMNFERTLGTVEARNYFMTELLFSDKDYMTLRANAQKAREILRGRCQAKQLLFDLDLEKYVPGARQSQTSCNI
ncbi:hypothetical protein D3C87_377520 [compost metagenome]